MGTPLDTTSPFFREHNYTFVIYWKPRGGVEALQPGHAALVIDSGRFRRYMPGWYVSWIGTGRSRMLGTIIKMDRPITWDSDSQAYGDSPSYRVGNVQHYNPTRWVALDGLDIDAMKTAWDEMRNKEGAHWKVFDKNCATAVARILKAGGGDQFARAHKKQAVWWPTDVIRYAKSMAGHIVGQS